MSVFIADPPVEYDIEMCPGANFDLVKDAINFLTQEVGEIKDTGCRTLNIFFADSFPSPHNIGLFTKVLDYMASNRFFLHQVNTMSFLIGDSETSLEFLSLIERIRSTKGFLVSFAFRVSYGEVNQFVHSLKCLLPKSPDASNCLTYVMSDNSDLTIIKQEIETLFSAGFTRVVPAFDDGFLDIHCSNLNINSKSLLILKEIAKWYVDFRATHQTYLCFIEPLFQMLPKKDLPSYTGRMAVCQECVIFKHGLGRAFSVDSDGSLIPCFTASGNKDFTFGSIYKGLNYEKINALSAKLKHKCSGCDLLGACFKGCILKRNNPCDINLCNFQKSVFNAMKEKIPQHG